MKKVLLGLGVILVGGAVIATTGVDQFGGLRANASRLESGVKTTLNTQYGDDWDDLLEDVYGDRWVDAIETKYQTSINEVIVSEVEKLVQLEKTEEQVEAELDRQYGDDWDDILEAVYGDDWEDTLRTKYGIEYMLKLQSELSNIKANRHDLAPLFEKYDDLDDQYDDLDDQYDDLDDQYDDLDDQYDDLDDQYDDLDDQYDDLDDQDDDLDDQYDDLDDQDDDLDDRYDN